MCRNITHQITSFTRGCLRQSINTRRTIIDKKRMDKRAYVNTKQQHLERRSRLECARNLPHPRKADGACTKREPARRSRRTSKASRCCMLQSRSGPRVVATSKTAPLMSTRDTQQVQKHSWGYRSRSKTGSHRFIPVAHIPNSPCPRCKHVTTQSNPHTIQKNLQ